MAQWEPGHCPLCGRQPESLVLEIPASPKDNRPDLTLGRCASCDTGILHPRPTVEMIGEFYTDDYDPYQVLQTADAAGLRLGFWRLAVQRALFGAPQSPLRQGLLAPGRILFNALATRPLIFLPKSGRVLDVGAGSGDTVRVYRALGYEAEGLEPHEKTCRYAREYYGLPMHCGTLDSLDVPEGSQDLVLLWNVLEHLHEPLPALRRVLALLKSGGQAAIALPNLDAWGLQQYGTDWYPLDPPRHLYHFTPRSLREVLVRAGFRNITIHGLWRDSLTMVVRSHRARRGASAPIVRIPWAQALSAWKNGRYEMLMARAWK